MKPLVILGFIFALWIAFIGGVEFGARDTYRTAVQVGNAEYYLDDDFKRQFRWKQCSGE